MTPHVLLIYTDTHSLLLSHTHTHTHSSITAGWEQQRWEIPPCVSQWL